MTIQSDIQSLSPGYEPSTTVGQYAVDGYWATGYVGSGSISNFSGLVEMFTLDLTAIGDSVYRFHAGTNELRSPLVWQGLTYSPLPIIATGFEKNGQGTLPRPTIKVANITGVMGALVGSLDDLIGGKVTRKRTFVKYLDSVNFYNSNLLNADPNQYFPDEVYFINRKISENKVFIEFELSSAMDVQGVLLPRRQVIQNTCAWGYRSSECSYAGGAVADINDIPTAVLANDVCSKRLSGCKLRFGTYSQLSFGAFSGAGLIT